MLRWFSVALSLVKHGCDYNLFYNKFPIIPEFDSLFEQVISLLFLIEEKVFGLKIFLRTNSIFGAETYLRFFKIPALFKK